MDKLEGRDQAMFDDRQRKLAAAQERRKAARSTHPVSVLDEPNDLKLLDISPEMGERSSTK